MRAIILSSLVLLSACEPGDGPKAENQASTLRGVAPNTAADSGVALLWNTYDPSSGYDPRSVSVVEQNGGFVLDLEPTLPLSARFAVENDSGIQTDPNAEMVGISRIYLTAEGAIENNRDGVIAMDLDAVIGWDETYLLAWWPVELESLGGIRGISDEWEIGLGAGYHLVDVSAGVEVPLDTELHAEIGPFGD